VAETVLGWFNIPALRDGNVLVLANQTLNVAEACSGIRSLLSLTFLSLVYAYFFDARVWMRWALLFGTIPIAILANAARVTVTGMLSNVDPDLAHGFPHLVEGFLIFVIALVMLFLLHMGLSRAANWLGSRERAAKHA
jgi:exosortase